MFNWIVQHIIGSIPAWVWMLVAGSGGVAYFFSGLIAIIPTIHFKIASITVKYIGFAILLFGVFMLGGEGVTTVWQEQIKEMAAKVAEAENKSEKVNTVIKEKIVKKIQIVKENTDANNQAIETKRDSINAECKLSDDAWMLYNRGAKNAVASGSSRARSTGK